MRAKNLSNNLRAFINLSNSLSRNEKTLLNLRFIKKMSLIEVANKLNVSNQTIKEREDKLIKKIDLAFDFSNLE
jgi:RNA polymerase sigma factor (sigma-70 family)